MTTQEEIKKIEAHKVKIVIDIDMTLGQFAVMTKLVKIHDYESLSHYMLEASLDQARRDCDNDKDLKKKLGEQWQD